jgi:hypothetical protein
MTSQRTLLSTAAVLAVAAALLTGCSAGAQTTAQACKSIESDVSSASTQLSSAFSNIQSDPKAAEVALAKFDTRLKTANKKITNAGIKAKVAATTKALDTMDSDLKAYVVDPSDTTALQSSSEKVQTAFTSLGKTCDA